jgi:hypothetical protein
MGSMAVLIVGRHVALPRGREDFHRVSLSIGLSAGVSITLALLRIEVRLFVGNGVSWWTSRLRSATQSACAFYRKPIHRDGAEFLRLPWSLASIHGSKK